MTPEARTALIGSIAKWQAIVDGTGADDGIVNCPLCVVFYSRGAGCEGCPVSDHTEQLCCDGSPYEKWRAAANNECGPTSATTPARQAAAQAELDFLKKLLEEDDAENR